jgi:hypothetical protein
MTSCAGRSWNAMVGDVSAVVIFETYRCITSNREASKETTLKPT